MIGFAIVLISGIAAFSFFPFFPISIITLCILAAAFLFFRKREAKKRVFFIILVFASGFLYSFIRQDTISEIKIPDGEVYVKGTVIDVPEMSEGKLRFTLDDVYIDGKRIPPSSSYCIAFNRELVFEKENLHLGPCDGNTHPGISKKPARYDTFDKANETLLKKGYRCYIVPEEEQHKYWAGFSGLSGPVMLLNYFSKPEQTLEYFREPPNEKWSSNMLFGVLSGMISICTIQDLYTELRGRPYPLRSLPSRDELMKIYEEKKPFMRDDQNLDEVEETSERLRNAI